MYFEDRKDAGKQLAEKLHAYTGREDVIVIALPRGGVVTGFEVAQALKVPLDCVMPRKIGAPGRQELAVGAITQKGEPLFNDEVMEKLSLSPDDVWHVVEQEKKEAQRRLRVYRGDRDAVNLSGKTVIVVDDGMATGSTMRAALVTIKHHNPEKIIVAVPVAPRDVLNEIKKEVGEVVCLHVPTYFGGIGAFYRSFEQVDDEAVVALVQRAQVP